MTRRARCTSSSVELLPDSARHEARVVLLPPAFRRPPAPRAGARRRRGCSHAASSCKRLAPSTRRPVGGDPSRHGGRGCRRCLRPDLAPLDRVPERGAPRDVARLARRPPARDGESRCPALPRTSIDAAGGWPDRRSGSVAGSGRAWYCRCVTPRRPGLGFVRVGRVPGNQPLLPRGRERNRRDGPTRAGARGVGLRLFGGALSSPRSASRPSSQATAGPHRPSSTKR